MTFVLGRALGLGVISIAFVAACGRSSPYDEVFAFDAGAGGGKGGSGGGSGPGGGGGSASCDAGCLVDPIFKTTTCTGLPGFTSVKFSGTNQGLVVLDMKPLKEVTIEADFCDPVRWTFSIGDSPTNNGYCGDGASRTNDAELWVIDGRVGVCESDLANGGMKKTWEFPGPDLIGCSTRRFRVFDSGLEYPHDNQSLSSAALFRFGAPDKEGGKPDWDLFVGLNQVPQGDRTGEGLRRIRINLGACR
jgi:hypothetical protein